MAIKIKPLRKFTTGVPSTSDMEVGELAVNTADKKIYMRDNTSGASSIVEVANASGSAADDITTGNAAVNIAPKPKANCKPAPAATNFSLGIKSFVCANIKANIGRLQNENNITKK